MEFLCGLETSEGHSQLVAHSEDMLHPRCRKTKQAFCKLLLFNLGNCPLAEELSLLWGGKVC